MPPHPQEDPLEAAAKALAANGITVPPNWHDALEAHLNLIRHWNDFSSLVSRHDAATELEAHVLDSLGLAPHLARRAGKEGLVLDIGTGGGFPIVPLKLTFPEQPMCWVERSAKKVGFLRKVLGELALGGVILVHGEFPQAVPTLCPQVITARAVEKPGRWARKLGPYLEKGAVLLCQSGEIEDTLGKTFHVEQIEDNWTKFGWRRGRFSLIEAAPSAPNAP